MPRLLHHLRRRNLREHWFVGGGNSDRGLGATLDQPVRFDAGTVVAVFHQLGDRMAHIQEHASQYQENNESLVL